ncbi:hypothetical protein RD792_014657 [Penstemon davidsonii]|uniref:Bet v I/Major latex protein domain-containing protein n=1 Tax=Penstemon davidsonii TaxID=160366 RepID=A0ABR0CPW4_9LAMI|nr:hypothetical protein RD792_014657 [Penstemon davidsonii]
MGLTGKLVAAIEFRAGGDVFHELVTLKPHHVSKTSPEKVQGCDLHEGEFGKVGSVICWRYTHGKSYILYDINLDMVGSTEGKEKTAKQLIQAIDEEKNSIEFKMLEGDLMKLYKDITLHIDTKDGIDLVTWTLEYETLHDDVEHPISLLSFFIDMTKDIENHHLQKA